MFVKNLLQALKRRQEAKERKKALKTTAVGLGIGAAAGAILGLLFAPKKGEETRKDLSEGAKKVAENAKEAAGTLKDKVGDSYQAMKSKVKEIQFKKRPEEKLLEKTEDEKVAEVVDSDKKVN